MRIGVYSAALGSIQQEMSMDVIANNLANASTPGYKKDGVSFSNYMGQSTYTDMQQGPIRKTGNPLNIALNGKGFLEVQSNQGIRYTRAGDLTLNSQNTLVTQEGWPVLDQSGQPIQFPTTTANPHIRIDSSGQVFDGINQNPIATIGVVQFANDDQLKKIGDNYFQAAPGQAQLMATKPYTIEQGALEEPNFNIVEQMAHMIQTSRIFESDQRVLQSFSQQESEVTKTLGNV